MEDSKDLKIIELNAKLYRIQLIASDSTIHAANRIRDILNIIEPDRERKNLSPPNDRFTDLDSSCGD